MDEKLEKAIAAYMKAQREPPALYLGEDGFYTAVKPCPLCKYCKWSSASGAHLRSVHHFAALYGVGTKEMMRVINADPEPPPYVFKCLVWNDRKGILVSPTAGPRNDGSTEFIPGSLTLATCDTCEVIPGRDHTCGIYAFLTPEDAWEYAYNTKNTVVAVLAYGGRTLFHGRDGVRTAAVTVIGIAEGRPGNPGEQAIAEKAASVFGVPLYPMNYEVKEEEEEEEENE